MTLSLRRILFSSLMVWFVVSVVGIYFLFHLHKFINFGIDLVGGTYITLEVQVDRALETEFADRAQAAVLSLQKEKLTLPAHQKITSQHALLIFDTETDAQAAEQFFVAGNSGLRARGVQFVRQNNEILLTLSESEIKHLVDDAVQSNIGVLRTRLDQFGVGELTIAAQGEKNIIVELPNVQDPQQAKAMIGRAALLEIKLVEAVGYSTEDLLKKYDGNLPENLMIVSGKEREGHVSYYVVPRFTDLTGKLLKDARMDFGGRIGAEPVVKFTFKPEGGEKFYALTSKNINRQVAVIVDGVVITAPVVNSPISTDGEITGNFTAESAQELALLLRSGAFVAPVAFVEERSIGPSLGQESIHQGLIACVVGLGLLFLFSVIIYKTAGILAFIVLIYNLLLILFALAWLGATLTLPGIAGMVLTIGMAIDASILIFERIREELSSGSTLRKAVNVGFSGAMSVILDSNLTHFLVALVLYKLGAGPIKGFAVTMIIGIASTLITGLLLLKSLFTFFIDTLGVQKIRI